MDFRQNVFGNVLNKIMLYQIAKIVIITSIEDTHIRTL